MKWMKAVFCSTLLTLTGPAFSNETQPESPQDYAYGLALDTTTPSQWYRVALPLAVYQQSTSPELHDVRVFNQMGDAVPFSLAVAARQQVAPETTPLRFFALDVSPVPAQRATDEDGDKILLRSKTGVEIVLEGEKAKSVGQHYLLTLPEGTDNAISVSQLQLKWNTPQGPWQGKASVWYSEDMKRWYAFREEMPLMDVSSGGDRLKLDRIDIGLTLSKDSIRYLLVVIDAKGASLPLTGVNAISAPAAQASEQIDLSGEGERLSATEAQWRWSRPQPLSSLTIQLDSDGVLPVEILWRGAEKDEWRPLKKTVLYQLEGKSSEPVSLSGEQVEAVKLSALNARLPETLPRVIGHRDRYDLVFNAQGKAPYLLAWGNGAATPASIALDMLIPADLRKIYDVTSLPDAGIQEAVKLGGDARLTATSVAEKESLTKTLLVWGVLSVGVLLLAGMAFRIWREVKKESGE
ncbi:DUF3999 domain-containing protein [Citrobacter amalonaticus]|uniref:DUF3999 domain-containing protein n=1 Tax=Citrobacter amalonaticus TaxID=35703 RepID=UPI00300CCB18